MFLDKNASELLMRIHVDNTWLLLQYLPSPPYPTTNSILGALNTYVAINIQKICTEEEKQKWQAITTVIIVL